MFLFSQQPNQLRNPRPADLQHSVSLVLEEILQHQDIFISYIMTVSTVQKQSKSRSQTTSIWGKKGLHESECFSVI